MKKRIRRINYSFLNTYTFTLKAFVNHDHFTRIFKAQKPMILKRKQLIKEEHHKK